MIGFPFHIFQVLSWSVRASREACATTNRNAELLVHFLRAIAVTKELLPFLP